MEQNDAVRRVCREMAKVCKRNFEESDEKIIEAEEMASNATISYTGKKLKKIRSKEPTKNKSKKSIPAKQKKSKQKDTARELSDYEKMRLKRLKETRPS